MTRQESFKKRIRARMAATGEKYGAARRVLIEQSTNGRAGRRWVSPPEAGDDSVVAATGRGWNDWCDVIDAWIDAAAGDDDSHAAVAAHLLDTHELDGWWAHQIAGGWERITGRRLPGQMPDGTFTANKSRTLSVDADVVRELLLDAASRADLFGGTEIELRSRPTSKSIRLGMVDGIAEFGLTPKGDGRVGVAIQHGGLASPDDIEAWKQHWSDWLDELEQAAAH